MQVAVTTLQTLNADTTPLGQLVKVRVIGYEEGIDVFHLSAYGFTDADEAEDPAYCHSAPDFDDFSVPGLLLPNLIGAMGEPSELLGKVFTLRLVF